MSMKTTTIITIDHLEINSKADLKQLLGARNIFRQHQAVKLNIEEFNKLQNENWEKKINAYYKACGCNEGKLFVIIFLLYCLIASYADNTMEWSWKYSGICLLYSIAGAFAGKSIGLLRAYVGLRKTVKACYHS